MAIRNIRKRRLRSWLTMIGIFIGILSIVSLISLGEGLRVAVANQFGNFAPDLLTISAGGDAQGPPGTGEVKLLDESLVNKISSLKEIKQAAGRNLDFGKIEFNNKVKFVGVVSMPDGKERKLIEYAINLKAVDGRLLKDGDVGKAFIGYKLTDENLFGKPIRVGSRIYVNDKPFDVVGVLEKKGNFMLDKAIFLNEDDHFSLFNREKGKYAFIAARYDDSYSVDDAQEAVSKLMRRERNVKKGNEDFRVSSPQSVIKSLNDTLFAIQLFVYIIASISIIVGGIGIMSTMYTTVVERTKEIGIMKSIGAKNNVIFTLFFIESGFIGLAGGIVGVIGGVVVAKGLAAIGKAALGSQLIQANVSLPLIIGSLLFSFLLGSIFGTFPALRASKMKPVDALSYVK